MARKKLILSCREMEAVALDIASTCGEADVKFIPIDWKSFEDGWPNIFVNNAASLQNADVTFLSSIGTPADVFAQYSVMCALPRYGVHSLKIVVPYFPTATMERVDEEGQIATAKTMARLLSSVPPTASGPPQVVIFDIHALAERFFFGDGVVPRILSLMPAMAKRLDPARQVIAFPDAGAQKRYGKVFAAFRQIICHKDRVGSERKVRIIEGDPKDADIVIVDDLVKTGGTLIECRHALIRGGANSVSVLVVHPVFPQDAWKKFTPDLFSGVIVSDTCHEMAFRVLPHKPFSIFLMDQALVPLVLEEC